MILSRLVVEESPTTATYNNERSQWHELDLFTETNQIISCITVLSLIYPLGRRRGRLGPVIVILLQFEQN